MQRKKKVKKMVKMERKKMERKNKVKKMQQQNHNHMKNAINT